MNCINQEKKTSFPKFVWFALSKPHRLYHSILDGGIAIGSFCFTIIWILSTKKDMWFFFVLGPIFLILSLFFVYHSYDGFVVVNFKKNKLVIQNTPFRHSFGLHGQKRRIVVDLNKTPLLSVTLKDSDPPVVAWNIERYPKMVFQCSDTSYEVEWWLESNTNHVVGFLPEGGLSYFDPFKKQQLRNYQRQKTATITFINKINAYLATNNTVSPTTPEQQEAPVVEELPPENLENAEDKTEQPKTEK